MSVFENMLSVFGDPLSVFENIKFPNTLSSFQIHSGSVFGRTIEGRTTTDVTTSCAGSVTTPAPGAAKMKPKIFWQYYFCESILQIPSVQLFVTH